MTRVFVSFSHQQGQWVFDRLVPVLKASGVEVLIDTERFRVGYAVKGEMDRTQDQADRQVLVITEAYLQSDYCQHELKRALALDRKFKQGILIPIRLDSCQWPSEIMDPNPLYVDLRGDLRSTVWKQLLDRVGGDLRTTAPDWLRARDHLVRCLENRKSVNLVVRNNTDWRPLMDHLRDHLRINHDKEIASVDLQNTRTFERQGLVREILREIGSHVQVPKIPKDMEVLQEVLEERSLTWLALTHFDLVEKRRKKGFDWDFFAGLRYLISERRTLLLIVQSKTPLGKLLPPDNPLSEMQVEQVELGFRS